jgi:PAS domain S-box-containing protein
MASSPEYARAAVGASRLAEEVFDALREVVLVVDAQSPELPLVMANAAARRCFLGDAEAISLVGHSLFSLLGAAAESMVAAAVGSLNGRRTSIIRMLPWRFPRGEIPFSSEMKLLPSPPGKPVVMVSFVDPSAESVLESGLLTAIEQLPLDLLILDKELTVTYANAGAARTAGSTSDGLLGLSAMVLAPTSAVPREALTAALEGRNFHDDAVAVTTPGVPTRWFEVDIQPLTDRSAILGVAVLSMEVTERRRHRRAAAGSERRLVALTAHARDIITVAALDGKVLYVSGGIVNSLGYTPEERLSHSVFDKVHPDDVDAYRLKFEELAAGTSAAFCRQLRLRHQDGSYRWMEVRCVLALDNPSVHGVVINARDVTERKQAESRLAQREEVFQLASDAVNGIIFEWDLGRGLVHRSRAVHDVIGLEPAELEVVEAWNERIHPQDAGPYADKTAAALAAGRGWTASYRIRNTHGRYRSILERALIQRAPTGEPIRAIGCAVDVSEIKRLTDLLGETQRIARMGGWEYSYATRELEWTEGMFRIFGTSPGEFEVSWASMIAQCPPDSRQRLYEAIETAESSDAPMDLEMEINTLKGERIWVRLLGRIEKLDGLPFRAFGSVQNVQSQKLAQMALETSTEWLKLSMNMAHIHGWRWNRTTDTLEFAIVDGQMVNLPRVFPGMKKLLVRVHPKDRLAVRRAIDEAFERRTEVQQEFRLKSHDGRYRAYATVALPLFDAAKQPSGMVGVTQEVTARHESQARLRRSEELLRTTTANTPDTLILVDTELLIRFINRDACGVRIDELVGRDISVLLPQFARDSVIEKLRRMLVTGETATYEFEKNSPGVGIEYFENRAVLVRDDGNLTGISITMRNITERKRLEREILEISSRERQAIGRDLHDGLGQELTGISLMLRGLEARVETNFPDSRDQVEEILGLVNQSIETARSLARGLLPVNTGGGGLAGALRSLADRSRDLYGLEVQCEVNLAPQYALSEATANHLYRITQEALTNIARHAAASAVSVCLTVTGKRFELRVADDGVGLAGALRENPGMGLKIMRYRASMIGASFEVRAHQPRGTVVCVTGQQSPVVGTVESAYAI